MSEQQQMIAAAGKIWRGAYEGKTEGALVSVVGLALFIVLIKHPKPDSPRQGDLPVIWAKVATADHLHDGNAG